ncbi:MAG: D-alanyl-D-alanine dipeptidase [Saprospiraceae bacterium]
MNYLNLLFASWLSLLWFVPITSPDVQVLTHFNYCSTQAADKSFVEINVLEPSIVVDIKYATTDNFVKEKMYNCGRCFLRKEAAAAIVSAHRKLQRKGLRLKIWDAYRPRTFQYKLWNKMPDPRYVMNPAKGSMHNRGAAVDLTIVDKSGKELDMGTPYDFFGEKAHHNYTKLPKNVLENRKLLKETMAAVGFNSIRTEWWHYSYSKIKYELSDWVWNCP